MKIRQDPFLLPVDDGNRFCIYRGPVDAPAVASVLHLPAFGDEMNKSRAMTARASRALAARGCGVLQIDLFGCGDSSGEHADATLSRWTADLRCAVQWLRARCGAADPWLWCLRSGALLAQPLLERGLRDAPLLLWQPLLSGAQQLTQLLRQKAAGEFLQPSESQSRVKALRERLRAGETLEIGGYAISPALADELERAAFGVPAAYAGPVTWLEVTSSPAPSLSPAARAKVESLRAAGVDVQALAVGGAGFWQSVEIESCEPLIDATVAAFGAGIDRGVSRDSVLL